MPPPTLILYGDYECPFTASANHAVREVQRRLGDAFVYEYRHFPLRPIHPHAQHAAEAAEAARAQNKFWEMHEHLFANQLRLSDADLVRYAQEVGLDRAVFVDDMRSHAHRDQVTAHFKQGLADGAKGTPTIFVNGVRLRGPRDAEAIEAALRAPVGK